MKFESYRFVAEHDKVDLERVARELDEDHKPFGVVVFGEKKKKRAFLVVSPSLANRMEQMQVAFSPQRNGIYGGHMPIAADGCLRSEEWRLGSESRWVRAGEFRGQRCEQFALAEGRRIYSKVRSRENNPFGFGPKLSVKVVTPIVKEPYERPAHRTA